MSGVGIGVAKRLIYTLFNYQRQVCLIVRKVFSKGVVFSFMQYVNIKYSHIRWVYCAPSILFDEMSVFHNVANFLQRRSTSTVRMVVL